MTLFSLAAMAASNPSESVTASVATAITSATALVSATAALLTAVRSARRARRAETSAVDASARADAAERLVDRLANAPSDGVVLVVSYPDAATSCRGVLDANGWRVAGYQVTRAELAAGTLVPGRCLDDVGSADAVVIEGLPEAEMARLASMRDFRDRIRAGASVVMFTAGRPSRYDLSLWGECDQGATTPVTTEAAVRASLARRDATARRQGIRPGGLAAARAALTPNPKD